MSYGGSKTKDMFGQQNWFLENQTDLPFCKRCVLHDSTCDMKKMNNVNK